MNFLQGLMGGVGGFMDAESRFSKEASDLANADILRRLHEQQIAQSMAQEAERVDRLRKEQAMEQAVSGLYAPKVEQLFQAGTDAGPSNQLTPIGQQQLQGLMGGRPETMQTPNPAYDWTSETPIEPQLNIATPEKLAVMEKLQGMGTLTTKSKVTSNDIVQAIMLSNPLKGAEMLNKQEMNDEKWTTIEKLAGMKQEMAQAKLEGANAMQTDKLKANYERAVEIANMKGDFALQLAASKQGGANISNTNDSIEAAAQAMLAGQKKPSSLTQRGNFRGEVEKRVLELNPKFNFIEAESKAKLQENVKVQDKAGNAAILPELIKSVENAGSKLDYSTWMPVARTQQFWDRLSGNPDYINAMAKRNDIILRLGNVMRDNGMTDKAQRIEEDSAPKTMSPKAFSAWAQAQYDTIKPIAEKFQSQATGKGTPLGNTAPTNGIDMNAVDAAIKRKLGR